MSVLVGKILVSNETAECWNQY